MKNKSNILVRGSTQRSDRDKIYNQTQPNFNSSLLKNSIMTIPKIVPSKTEMCKLCTTSAYKLCPDKAIPMSKTININNYSTQVLLPQKRASTSQGHRWIPRQMTISNGKPSDASVDLIAPKSTINYMTESCIERYPQLRYLSCKPLSHP